MRRPSRVLDPTAYRGLLGVALLAVLLTGTGGCAGHEVRVDAALAALDRGQPERAVAELNEEMGVESDTELPIDLEGDNALLLLERASVQQSLARYLDSARDFGAADKAIDMLDLSASAADEVGRYLFSESVTRYRAPAFEKLLINSFNMMNYLAQRDVAGAKVEARRLAIVQRYLKEQKSETRLVGLGSYLAGFAFEKAGQRDEALRYYEEALASSSFPSLRDPLRVLTRGEPRSKAIDALVADTGPLPPPSETRESELVVVVGYGRVPRKVPVRLPIGLALSLVSHQLSPRDHGMAAALAAKGLVTWVNFPRLGKTRGAYAIPQVWLDGQPVPLDHAVDVEAEVRREWDRNEGTVIVSAITRLLTRAAAGELVQAGVNAASSEEKGILGLFAGLVTTATLAAADTPDTRSWTTLPANVALTRLRVRPGLHRLRITARGRTKEYEVRVRPGDWAFATMSSLR